MKKIYYSRELARLIILQRIELISPFLKKIRKLLGRYFFSNIAAKYLTRPNIIVNDYIKLMEKECDSLQDFINFSDKKILSIGSGMGGLELAINKKYNNSSFDIIEKDYTSQKVKYGWDQNNKEAYNNLKLLSFFLKENGIKNSLLNIYDCDFDNYPRKKFDIIISLFSLDYHYDFNIYQNYLKKISDNKTSLIFDTIRPDYFKNIFKNVKFIQSNQETVHKSKRIICNKFLSQ